ncbi:TPA: glycosyltransferase family 2 protein, partial [Escherichia coli]|nr:glycosyltransferase family 2 protein [Escherichia coli]
MKTYISIISHGHIELIKKLGCLNKLAEEFTVIVKLNKKEKISSDDIFFKKILVLDEKYNRGFGENNNIVFNYCRESLGMDKNDIFIVLNPDVYVETATIRKLVKSIVSDQARIATINLF